MDSILDTVKRMLGIPVDIDDFDVELIVAINGALMTLCQYGVGPEDPLAITDNSTTWNDLLGEGSPYKATAMYVYLKVRMLFDPPAASAVLDAMNRQVQEYEWRLILEAERRSSDGTSTLRCPWNEVGNPEGSTDNKD